MTETSGTPSAQMQKQQVQRRWCWLTAWRGLTGVVLLLSPFLGFVISGIAIVLITGITPSGRQRWFGKLVLALVLLVPARIAGFYTAYGWGYARGYQEAVAATARGEEHRFLRENNMGQMVPIQ